MQRTDIPEQLNAHKFTQVLSIFHHFLGLFDSQDELWSLKLKINSIFFFFFFISTCLLSIYFCANYSFRVPKIQWDTADTSAIMQPTVYWGWYRHKLTRLWSPFKESPIGKRPKEDESRPWRYKWKIGKLGQLFFDTVFLCTTILYYPLVGYSTNRTVSLQ